MRARAAIQVPVRRACAADWAAVRAVRLAALAFEPECFGTGLEQDQALTEADWELSLSANHWLVAEDRDETVGLVALFPGDTYPEGLAQLGSMWVSPARRRQGLAGWLENAVEEAARAAGLEGLGLWVTEGNERAAAAYAAMGYRLTGAQKPAPRDPTVAMHRMVRTFRPAGR